MTTHAAGEPAKAQEPMTFSTHRHWLALAITLASASCSDGGASFDVRYAPGFSQGPTTVSVLGVFQGGRMSPEAWAEIGPPLSAALGQRKCEAAYGEEMQREAPESFADLEEYTMNNGVTEELLERLAPSASGEMILTISVHGRSRASARAGAIDPRMAATAQQPLPGSRLQTGRVPGTTGRVPGQGTGAMTPNALWESEGGELEIAASLFSVRLHRPVARVTMIYSGSSAEDAISRFAKRLRAELPGSTCRGWRWAKP